MSDFRFPAPNVFGCFEATVGVLGASVVFLGALLLCAWKLPCKDVAKPFFVVLAISMIVSVAGSITLLIFSESMQIASPAYSVQMYARYISFISLLFGGGFHLISTGNAARTGNGSAGCSTWFVHFAIALAALAILFGSRAYFLESTIMLLAYCLPLMGLIFFLATFAIGYRLAGRANDQATKAENPARTSFTRLAFTFAAPTVMIAITRGEEGATLLIRVISNISRNSLRSYDRFGILDAVSTMAWNRPIDQLELFFPIAIVLSAVLFHPSVRGLFCRSGNKVKIAPVAEEVGSSNVPQPVMMNPMMTMHQQMIPPQTNVACYNNQMLPHMISQTPISQMATPMTMSPPQPIALTHLPTMHQYPSTMHGMGGRPVYMMA